MLLSRNTPSSVLYADLRSYGGMKNVEAARILLSAKVSMGGKTPRDRIESPTYLSRQVVHATPDDVSPALFADFYASTQTIFARVLAYAGGASAIREVTAHYSGPAATQMTEALAAYHLDAQLYRNEVARILQAHLRSERDRPLLLLMLFCIVGCLADPERAVRMVEEFARHKLAQDLATASASFDGEGPRAENSSLGLLRIIDNAAQPPIMPLNPMGSILGSLASGPGAITDVGPDVSRQHARVWFDGSRWLCKGLGSTNGTFIIQGADHSTVVVEPPRSRQTAKIDYPPQELHESDMLCLGSSTRFLVMRMRVRD